MTIAEIFVLAFALAMDAVAVSVAQGMRMRHPRWRDALLLAGAFGVFQAVMPLGGWVLSFWFARVVSAVAPWIAFVLLAVLGALMLREAFSDDEDDAPADGSDPAVAGGTPGARVATYLPLTLAEPWLRAHPEQYGIWLLHCRLRNAVDDHPLFIDQAPDDRWRKHLK